jgi:hypothetical protein
MLNIVAFTSVHLNLHLKHAFFLISPFSVFSLFPPFCVYFAHTLPIFPDFFLTFRFLSYFPLFVSPSDTARYFHLEYFLDIDKKCWCNSRFIKESKLSLASPNHPIRKKKWSWWGKKSGRCADSVICILDCHFIGSCSVRALDTHGGVSCIVNSTADDRLRINKWVRSKFYFDKVVPVTKHN